MSSITALCKLTDQERTTKSVFTCYRHSHGKELIAKERKGMTIKRTRIKNPRLIYLFIITAFVLTGCMSMPIMTMYKLSQLSPLDIQPSNIRVALRTDKAITIEDGATEINMSYYSEGGHTLAPVSMEHSFYIRTTPQQASPLSDILLDGMEDNEQITLLSLSDEQAQKMADILAIAKKYKANDIKGKGEFSIHIQEACFGNISQFDSLALDIFLQTDAADGYMMFLENIDIIEQAEANSMNLAQTNTCETQSY
jgi:hypothetical protein